MPDLIDRLTQYNAWRRDKTDDPQPDPVQVGKDIDEAIARLAAAERLAGLPDRVEDAIRGWRFSRCNADGEYIGLYDLLHGDGETVTEIIDDLVDHVCGEALTAYTQTRKEQDDEN